MITQSSSRQTHPHSAPNLHARFRHYGTLTLAYRNKCIGMLPRIFKEKIYVEKGFDSIFEYAAKFAGMSREQVKRALSLHASFYNKPDLTIAMETGEVSINKLAKIASIATVDNQEFLSDQAKLLSCRALETLVRDAKYAQRNAGANTCAPSCATTKISNQNGLFKPKTDGYFVHVNNGISIANKISTPIRQSKPSLELSSEVQEKLLELKSKGLDVNAILLELLAKREEEIEQEKEKIVAEQTTRATQLAQTERQDAAGAKNNTPQKPSRYIPAKTRRILQKEHGTQCAKTGCARPAKHIHHTRRYYLDQSHDPHYLAPLCREHHQIAHSIDIRFHEMRREKRNVNNEKHASYATCATCA